MLPTKTGSSLAALAAAVLLSASTFAEEDAGLWFTGTGVLAIDEAWFASLALQPRFDHDIARLERFVIRPSVSRRLGNGHTATLGYDAHVIEAPRDSIEHRTWQEWGWRLPVKIRLRTRVRLEQRYVENVDGTAVRLRLMGIWRRPLGNSGWTFELNDEVFFGMNDVSGGPRDGYDQNRFYAGFARKLNEHLTGGIGYQMQHINRARDDLTLHQVFLTLTVR